MLGNYPIFSLTFDPASLRLVRGPETLGTKQKWWLINRANGRMVLLKLARPGSGEDWSEKVAFEVAKCLGIPCPRVELAECEQRWGVLCWDFLARRHLPGMPAQVAQSLIHGNELLLQRDPNYPVNERYRVSAHTIASVHEVLKTVDHMGRESVLDGERGDGFDMFVGYLLLDALIGNGDRHHENWGVIASRGQRQRLAPSYDHASSLGRELSDAKRTARLGDSGRGTVAGYASKTASAFWSDVGGTSLTPNEALLGAARLRPQAFAAWQRRLTALPTQTLERIVERVPDYRLSATGKRFTLELLRYNRHIIIELRL